MTLSELSPGPARAGEIGCKLLLVELDDGVRLGISRIDAGVGHDLHQVDDLAPAVLVEAELEHVARRVASGAGVAEDPLDARVLVGLLRQRRHQHFARQLSHPPLGIGHRPEREVGPPRRREIDLALGRLERQRLRPHVVFARGQRRKVVAPLLVGVDAGGDGGALRLGRHRHAAKLLARRGRDRPAEQLIGGLRRA